MYKVIIVDDERIIRESISKIILWEQYGFELVGVAANGIEALTMIDRLRPDLILTDMKMPVLNGNQLVEKVKSKYPDTEMVVLSGYDDFEYVSEAMKHGVKHYILKPCGEKEIIDVLIQVGESLHKQEEKKDFIRKNNEKMEKVIPLVKEQFIRDFIMSRSYTEDEMAYFKNLFNVTEKQVRLVLLKPHGDYSFNTLFALTNMIRKGTFNKNIYFLTIINKYVVIITEEMQNEEILESALSEILESFRYLMSSDLVISYTKEGLLEDVSSMFHMAQKYLEVSFYFGNSCIISYNDVELGMLVEQQEELEVEALITAVRSGNKDVFLTRIDKYFDLLMKMKPEIDNFKYYCIEIASGILRQCPQDKSQDYISSLLEIREMSSFDQVRQAIVSLGSEIVELNYSGIMYRQNKTVETMLREIEERLDDENLSLKSLANDVMFMNSGYLSKLFSKETGITFSNYLTKRRMERSKEIIKYTSSLKMYEVAVQVGMGNNPQYFSQLFKKFFGVTPTEYKNNQTK